VTSKAFSKPMGTKEYSNKEDYYNKRFEIRSKKLKPIIDDFIS